MKKRILSVLLAVCIVLTFMPITAFAANFSGYTALSNASDLSVGLTTGKYYLANNITVSDTITVTGNSAEITLDLNGYTLNISSDKPILDLGLNVTTFNLYDTSDSKSGTISGGKAINLTTGSAGCVYGHRYTFNMYGGTIKNCSNNTQNSAGAVMVGLLSEFNMYGGTIESCTTSANYSAGGVYVRQSGKFNMSGGIIKSCKTTANYSAGGVYLPKEESTQPGKAEFNLSDNAKIYQCYAKTPSNDLDYAKGCVGGVYNNGKFNMSGGNIESCTLEGINSTKSLVYGLSTVFSTSSANAAGLYNGVDGIFTIKSGKINSCYTLKVASDSKPESVGLGNAGTIYAHGGYILGLHQFYEGTITKQPSVTDNTEFAGSLTNYGTIEAGNFSNLLTNYTTISGGIYTSVENTHAYIIPVRFQAVNLTELLLIMPKL